MSVSSELSTIADAIGIGEMKMLPIYVTGNLGCVNEALDEYNSAKSKLHAASIERNDLAVVCCTARNHCFSILSVLQSWLDDPRTSFEEHETLAAAIYAIQNAVRGGDRA